MVGSNGGGTVTIDDSAITINKNKNTNTNTCFVCAVTSEKVIIPVGVKTLNIKIQSSTIYIRFGISSELFTTWSNFIAVAPIVPEGEAGTFSLDVSNYAGTGTPYYIVLGVGYTTYTGISKVSEVWFDY